MIGKILGTLFKAREKTGLEGGAEMSFWDHLDDLRKVIGRMLVSFLVIFILCVSMIQNRLMPILKAPVESMWTQQVQATLPEKISVKEWEKAQEAVDSLSALKGDSLRFFEKKLEDEFGEKTLLHIEVVKLYRAVQAFDAKQQKDLISSADDFSAEVKALTLSLYEQERLPNADKVTKQGKQVMGTLKPSDGFMVSIKVSFFAALALSFPLLLFFALQFILPGLHKNERGVLWPALFIGFTLFLGGICFSYFQVIPKVLAFFYTYTEDLNASNTWTIDYYISFVTQLCLVFGLAFELPVVVLALVKLGLLSFSTMNKTRSYAVVAILVIAALITPTPDIPTLMFLAVPMYLLYEISIWISFFIGRKERKQQQLEEEQYQRDLAKFILEQEALEEESDEEEDYHSIELPEPEEDLTNEERITFDTDEDEYHDFEDEHDDDYDFEDDDDFIEEEELAENEPEEGAEESENDDSDVKNKPDH